MQREKKALMISNLALLLVIFRVAVEALKRLKDNNKTHPRNNDDTPKP